VRAQPDLELAVHAQTAVELAMIFWSEIAPLELALAVTSASVGAHSAGRRRRTMEEEGRRRTRTWRSEGEGRSYTFVKI